MWNPLESITGYKVIEAEGLDAMEKPAQDNPFIASIRIYEVRSMQIEVEMRTAHQVPEGFGS